MTFDTINPATGEKLRTAHYATPAQIDASISTLHKSFSGWRNISYRERQLIVKKIALNLQERSEEFAVLMSTEMGKPIREAKLEVKKCIVAIEALSEKDLGFLEPKLVSGAYKNSRIINEPLGVIYSVMPWNFPLWQVVRMVIPALLAGNTILLKHSTITSQTGDEFEKILKDIWSEPLLLHQLVQHDNTEKILKDPRIQGVSLTGSTGAGLSVAQAAGAALKKYVLELGGSDPYIVLEDAPLEAAAKMISRSRLMNTGQSCICAKRLLVHTSKKDQLIDLVKKEFDSFQFGSPLDAKTDLGPLAHPRFKADLAKQISELKLSTEAKNIYHRSHLQNDHGAYVDLNIFLLPKNSDWLYEQEFFSPTLIVIPFLSDQEAIQIANSTAYGLGGGVWSTDLTRATRMASQMTAGQVAINDMIKSDVSLPFGGFKKSGVGRELGDAGLYEFTQTKVISSSL